MWKPRSVGPSTMPRPEAGPYCSIHCCRQKHPETHPPSAPALQLWLAGYHTPSLNVTTGAHWRTYAGLKQQAAAALLGALLDRDGPEDLRQACLVLDALAKGGRGGARGRAVKAGAMQRAASARQARPGRRLRLRYVRVTTRPLDVENFCGSTKALTDCLRLAFPDLLPDDAPEWVRIEHEQERCRHKDEEGTWVHFEGDDA